MSNKHISKYNERVWRIAGTVISFALVFSFIVCFCFSSALYGRTSKGNKATAITENSVYLGGIPVGLKLMSDGVTVAGFVPIITADGTFNPAEKAGLQVGDLIVEGNGSDVKTPEDVANLIKNSNGEIVFKYKRADVYGEVKVSPLFDPLSGEKKIGVIVKNEIAGVGTLTFTEQNGRFCTLGHQISDPGIDDAYNYQKGFVYSCKVLGAVKGVKGEAGALKGVFDRDSVPIGTVNANGALGVYGTADGDALKIGKPIEIGKISEVKPGKAYIYSTIEGETPKRYDIEIVKTLSQTERDTKGLVIRVTDKTLLKITGGIVQGMSGSPIVQNGKLVGAVTHVLVDDPMYGYGIYAEWLTE